MKRTLKYSLLAGALLLSLASYGTVLADDFTGAGGENPKTDLSFTVNQGYKVTIPAALALSYDSGTRVASGTSGVVKIHTGADLAIAEGKKLQVKLTNSSFKVKASTTEYDFTVQKGSSSGDALSTNGVVIEANAAETATKEQALYYQTAAITQSGSYAGTATFAIEVVDQ